MTITDDLRTAVKRRMKREGGLVNLAKAADVDPGSLSKFMAGKLPQLGWTQSERLCSFLGLRLSRRRK